MCLVFFPARPKKRRRGSFKKGGKRTKKCAVENAVAEVQEKLIGHESGTQGADLSQKLVYSELRHDSAGPGVQELRGSNKSTQNKLKTVGLHAPQFFWQSGLGRFWSVFGPLWSALVGFRSVSVGVGRCLVGFRSALVGVRSVLVGLRPAFGRCRSAFCRCSSVFSRCWSVFGRCGHDTTLAVCVGLYV